MRLYFAPLEGVTDAIYRRLHHKHFGGVDKYFIPFVSPTQNFEFSNRDLRSIEPAANQGVPAVPQLMTRNPDHFVWAAEQFAEMGYTEVNLNLGCPSGTVTAKGKGSGMLRDLDALRRFLEHICAASPLPVSLKTRIGFESPEEWERLLPVLTAYPIRELIIHPRTRQQFYKGQVYPEAFGKAFSQACCPVVYNGDLFTAADCHRLMEAYPATHALMLGRGLIANPALAQQITGADRLTVPALKAFHDDLYRAYEDAYPRSLVIGRMREVMKHLCCCFDEPKKPLKVIRKANDPAAYLAAVEELFAHPLRKEPGFYVE